MYVSLSNDRLKGEGMKYKSIKKLYYSISEISEMLGIKQSVIRYWESEFKELKPQKNRAGNRIYKKDDIAILKMIHHYVHEKHLSIHEANEVITDLKKEGLYKRKLAELNKIPVKSAPPEEEEETESRSIEITEYEEETSEEVEEMEKESEDKKQKPDFEIVSPTEDTFIYPLDETQDIEEKSEEPEEKSNPEPEPEHVEIEPVPEDKPKEEKKEVVIQNDPELKELLKKISSNIKDIIDILNE